jgi:hypothetical protein
MTDLAHPPSLARVTLHTSAPTKRLALSALIVLLYAVVSVPVYSTIGEPRQAALAKLANLTSIVPTLPVETTTTTTTATTNENKDEWELAEELMKEEEKLQEKIKEQERKIPPWYLPNAWGMAAMMLVIVGHALFHLMCRWMVGFKAATLYSSTKEFREGNWILVRFVPLGCFFVCLI